MIPKTKRFIEHCATTNQRIMVPTPVLAEYLCAFPPEEHESHLLIFERSFYLAPLDISSARTAASLLYDPERLKRIRDEHKIDRQSLRTDALIIAIAIEHGASKIITHDGRHFRKLAKASILVEDIPDISEQPFLFDD